MSRLVITDQRKKDNSQAKATAMLDQFVAMTPAEAHDYALAEIAKGQAAGGDLLAKMVALLNYQAREIMRLRGE